MALDAVPIERAKKFKYRLEINGLPVGIIKKVKWGDMEVGVSKHSSAGQNFDTKEAGKLIYHPLTLENVVPLDGPGKAYWFKWMKRIQDPVTGNGMRPSEYKQDFSIYDEEPGGDPIRIFQLKGGFISKYNPGERDSGSDNDDMMEEVTLEYDWPEAEFA